MGEVGEAKEGERKCEGNMYVQECDISDQNATLKDWVELVSGFDYGKSRALGAGAVPARPGLTAKHPGAI